MPSFDDIATTSAPPEEVWKVLYDPVRFPEWWKGIESVQAEPAADSAQTYTMYPDGYPDFPMPQVLRSSQHEGLVTISCLVPDLVFEWRLESADDQPGTRIRVHVEIPEAEAARLDGQREVISRSLTARPSGRAPRLVDPTGTFHRLWRPRMTPTRLAPRKPHPDGGRGEVDRGDPNAATE